MADEYGTIGPGAQVKKLTTTPAARKMLELSALTSGAVQREIMGTDVDVQRFALYLSQKVKTDLAGRITEATISRSIDASSELKVTVNDYDRALLNSGLLYNKLDVELDGLWFRLTGVDFSSMNDELILTFMDREICVLRTYNSWRMAKRTNLTRAQFVNALIKEVKEFPIPVVIPYLHTVQIVERWDGDKIGADKVVNKNKGIKDDANQQSTYGQSFMESLTGSAALSGRFMAGEDPAYDDQITNARVILQVGDGMEKVHSDKYAWRKLKVCAMMAAIHESRLRNIPVGDPTGMAQGIDDYLKGKGSPLAGYGDYMVTQCSAHNVDPRLMVAISYGESGFGLNLFAPYAAWGTIYGPGFNSWNESIAYEAQYLGDEYIALGLTTVQKIGDKYCPVGAANDPTGLNKNWIPNVNKILLELGGDSDDVTYHGGAPAAGAKKKKDTDNWGLFQMDSSWGSKEDRLNPETAARMFYIAAMKAEDRMGPTQGESEYGNRVYELLCLETLFPGKLPAPGTYGDPFSRWKDDAEYWVTKSGTPGGDREMDAQSANNQEADASGTTGEASGMYAGAGTTAANTVGEYYFYRGTIEDKHGRKVRKKEDSWTCIGRLAKDVNWRAFFVSGTFYFLSEDDLIKQVPMLTFNEFLPGVRSVEGNFYQKKQAATLTITVDVGRWSIPPGCVVEVEMLGVFNGRWLVSEYSRSLFDLQATVTLSRELPKLPEPLQFGDSEAKQFAPAASGTTFDNTSGDSGLFASPYWLEDPKTGGTSSLLAKRLLNLSGKTPGWRDYNTGLTQMNKTVAGTMLTNPGGKAVAFDPRVISIVLWLISQNFVIGTYAWCEDHPSNPESRHWLGLAVDIEYINGQHINQDTEFCKNQVLRVATMLHGLRGDLAIRQLICGGYGNHRDDDIRKLCLPEGSAGSYYDEGTMSGHCNHIHVGY